MSPTPAPPPLRSSSFCRSALAVLIAGAALSAAPAPGQTAPQPAETGVLSATVPEVPGPRRTVAVGKVDAVGSFTQKYGQWDIGGGLGSMLTTALVESQRFIVVERANIAQVLSEQELKGSGAVNPLTGPDLGNLIGAQLLLYGTVTEFDTDEKGGGFSLGASGGSGGGGLFGAAGGLLGAALSHQSSSGAVAIDLRIVDTTTGQVLETHRVREPIDQSGWDISLGYKGVSLGTNQFYKTPLGVATRNAITKLVQALAVDAGKRPWSAQVVEFDDGKVFINAGGLAGLKTGDSFMVERITRKLTDPQTGQVLSVRKKALGLIQLDEIEERLAGGKFSALDPEAPQRGDLVVTVQR